MTVSNDLDCKIFFHFQDTDPEMIAQVLQSVDGGFRNCSQGKRRSTIQGPMGEIDLSPNDDADDKKAILFPDGFLYFRQALEYYPCRGVSSEQRKNLISNLLKGLWARSIPAVAACDYEDELPEQGGNNCSTIPWPGRSAVPLTNPLRETTFPQVHP